MGCFRFIFFCLFLPVFLIYCTKGIETNRFPLTETEIYFVPYQVGDSMMFTHSNGFSFYFKVVSIKKYWLHTEFTHPDNDYWSYEVLDLKLQSNEPDLIFRLIVQPQSVMKAVVLAKLNNVDFNKYSLSKPDLEGLLINGRLFRDVFCFTQLYLDTNLITFDSIFYTKHDGLIKISMTNDESYFINN